ncbi:MAG TPA: AAA family ATPase [Sandaracinaceae bacterium LLY-WYZ-13_1]|nr:AAA family ATPase [Sandaracinaceae bacterium LLY-WYZ-13_1]
MSKLTLRLEAYEKDARQLIAAAQALADERGNTEVEPLHLLYRLVEGTETVQDSIRRAGVDPTDLLVEAEAEVRKLPKASGAVSYLSPRMLDLLGRAEGEAARDRGSKVSVSHLLVAAAQETSGPVGRVLRAVGLSAPILRAAASSGGASYESGEGGKGGKEPAGDPLELYGRDLTRLAAQGRFDPVVGRDAELRRILQVLARRHENNPLLVGEPGVGRNSIVRGLAMRMAKGDVPKMLQERRLVALEVGALVAGAKLRGQLEERMRGVLDAVRDSGGEVILVIPDLANLVGDRGQGGAADLFSVALARGEVRSIAVATPDGMRKAFDENSGLSRRFVPIAVEAPTQDEAVAVLRGIVERFEMDHGLKITDPALVSAVRFARRYVPGVQLPKSAIDLIDEAAARVRVEMESVPAELDAMERRLERLRLEAKSLEDDTDSESLEERARIEAEIQELEPKAEEAAARWNGALSRMGDVRRLKEELAAAQREYDQARAAEDHAKAGELRFGTLPLLEKKLEEAEAAAGEPNPDVEALIRDKVIEADVADVVAAWTGVPVSRMLEGEAEKLLKMEERLSERVIGQETAVLAVSKAVRRGRVGLRDPRKPIGSFLFLGPTGVGKTELAKALAEFLFDDEHSLTRLDMSEFMEKHMVARLLGSPPGYVDSDEGGYLTEAVRSKPYSVVLFDEMEKAHPDVFNILLQVLDDGRLTDSRGRLAHFTDTVIIMTSNVGGHVILDHEGTNEELKEKLDQQLHSNFRPEFLNRVDDTIIFDPLSREDLRGIVDIQLRELSRLLSDKRIDIEVSDEAKDRLVDLGYEPAFGARPLKRVILKHLQDPLAEALLRGGYVAGDVVQVGVSDGEFTFDKRGHG